MTADRLLRSAFVVSFGLLCITFGVFAVIYRVFPAPQIIEARATVMDLAEHWRNDLALEPTRHLVPADDPQRVAFQVEQPASIPPGSVIIGGLAPDRGLLQGATLYDEQGNERHHWAIDYEALDPEGEKQENVMLHGMLAFPDGSIAVAFDNGNVIARIDACGEPLWVTQGRYHHVVANGDDGVIWSWVNDILMKLDADTGRVLKSIHLKRDIIGAQNQYGVFSIRTTEDPDQIVYQGSAFHSNDVEPLTEDLAPAFPMFETGDLLISLRELNLVAVIDPETGLLKWWKHGPWFRQHDPDFLPDGRISVFDNQMGLGASRIIAIDPATDEWDVTFEGGADLSFYTWQRGTHQVLDNGAILMTEPEQGRVLLADADGGLIWRREMIFDETQNHIITAAAHYPPGFFETGAFDCPHRADHD